MKKKKGKRGTGGQIQRRRERIVTVHIFLAFIHRSRIIFLKTNNLENTKHIPTHLSHWNNPRFNPVAPRHPVYLDFGAPRHTGSKPRLIQTVRLTSDQAKHSHPIISSEIQRRIEFGGTGVSCTRSHHSVTQSFSLFSPATPSLSSDLHFPAISILHTTTERLIHYFKAKPRRFQPFSPPHLAGKRSRSSPATEASSRRFSLVSHQQPSRPPSSESSTSDLPESTVRFPESSPENFASANSSRAWATRATSGIFVNSWEIRGYFGFLPIQGYSGNYFFIFWIPNIFFYFFM